MKIDYQFALSFFGTVAWQRDTHDKVLFFVCASSSYFTEVPLICIFNSLLFNFYLLFWHNQLAFEEFSFLFCLSKFSSYLHLVLAFEYQIFIDKGLTSLNIELSSCCVQSIADVSISHLCWHCIKFLWYAWKKRKKTEQINTFLTNLSILFVIIIISNI